MLFLGFTKAIKQLNTLSLSVPLILGNLFSLCSPFTFLYFIFYFLIPLMSSAILIKKGTDTLSLSSFSLPFLSMLFFFFCQFYILIILFYAFAKSVALPPYTFSMFSVISAKLKFSVYNLNLLLRKTSSSFKF